MSTSLNDLRSFAFDSGWPDNSLRGILRLDDRINDTIHQLARLRNWSWYQHLGFLQTAAPYSTGTVTVTVSSATVAGSATAFAAGMVGQEFYGPDAKQYIIASVESPTSLTLEEPYLGDTAAAQTLSIRYVRYAVPSGFDRARAFRHRTLGPLALGYDLGEWLDRRANNPTTATGPSKIWVTRSYFYVDPAPSQADQIRYAWQKVPDKLTDAAHATDWPDDYMWLLRAALTETVRLKNAQEAAAVLQLPPFQNLVDRCWTQSFTMMEPITATDPTDDWLTADEVMSRYTFPDT